MTSTGAGSIDDVLHVLLELISGGNIGPSTFLRIEVIAETARFTVGCETPNNSAISACAPMLCVLSSE